MASFVVGESFGSYEELHKRVKAYQKANFVQLTHRDSRTLQAARKRVPKRVEGAKTDLQYYSVHLACVFGGKKYVGKGTGQRPLQSTVKLGCTAGVKLRLSDDRQSLTVTDVCEEHTHEVHKDIFEHLPFQRRLDENEKKEVEELLKLKVNKKLLQQHMSDTAGKVVMLKDISNIQTSLHKKSDRNDLDALVSKLKGVDGSSVEVFTGEDKAFTGLFFQDFLMKVAFEAYPEVLMIDATYKLNELRMPLYLMLIVDSNGQSEIVGVFLTVIETQEAITEMVHAFKHHNTKWSSTNVVISDKDFTERAVFHAEFPDAALIICLFHTLRSFKREVTCEKLGISPGEREHALEILTKLAYSSSAAEYAQHYQDLQDSRLRSVIAYYNSNWHPIRHQWVECFKGANFTVGERTNNRLESINAKIKSVCSKYASLSTFFDQFFAVLACLRNERDHSTLMVMAKKRVTQFPPDSAEEQFAQIITPYALNYVHKQIALSKQVKIDEDDGTQCKIVSSNGTLTVTTDSCQCTFSHSMHLPCRHIFAVREKRQVPLFSAACVSQRWTMRYMHTSFTAKKRSVSESSLQITSIVGEKEKVVLPQQQKFHKSQMVTQQLASLASEGGMAEFEERLSLLKKLKSIWSEGKRAIVDVSTDVHSKKADSVEPQDCPTGVVNVQSEEAVMVVEPQDSPTCSQPANGQIGLSELKMPPAMRKRGRPKGAEKTVIGLPRKKFKGNRQVKRPVSFLRKCPAERDRVMLLWFVDLQIAEAALTRKKLVEECDVEVRPEYVPSSCLDENVCLSSIQKYFTPDAWCAVTSVVELMKINSVWYCGSCTNTICDDTENSVVCESCLTWFHFECVSLKKHPKCKQWFCRNCHL